MVENRHQKIGLSDEDVLNMYQMMLLARRIDERLWLLNRAGKIPFVVSCQGQEAAQIGAAFALDRDIDYIAPYYRDLGVVLAFGMTPTDIMLSSFGKAEDPNSGGRQMPGHYGQKKNRILTGSSPVTTQIPHAVGVALGARMEGKQLVSFVTLGEGSTNQGDFHEGLNFAGVQKLPVITMVENNGYAISVPIHKQLANPNIADRALSYGMKGIQVDGTDPLAVYEVMKEAREHAISGKGPVLIDALTYRLTSHSSDDNDRQYREEEELREAQQHDSLMKFEQYLRDVGVLTDPIVQEMEANIMQTVNEATDYADQAPYAEPDTLSKYVYEE